MRVQKTWDESSEGPAVWIDGGNSAALDNSQEAYISRLVFETMADMGYTAVALGQRDLSNEPGPFSSILEGVPLPYLSANLRFHDTGERPFPAYRIVSVPAPADTGSRGPLRIGIIGYTWPWVRLIAFGPGGRSLIGTDPLDEVASILPEVRSQSDVVVLMTAEDEGGSDAIVRALPGIDLALVGTAHRVWQQPRMTGETTVFHSGDRGREVVRVAIRRAGSGYALDVGTIHLAEDSVEEDPETAAAVEEAITGLNERSRALMTAHAADGPPPSTEPYVGAVKCLECHAREFEVWSGSRHADAFETLVKARRDYTLSCVFCHVTGWLAEGGGGFRDPASTPEMTGVQCEACHGAGRSHVDDPVASYGAMPVPDGCQGCHDPHNSADFDYATYWPRIAH